MILGSWVDCERRSCEDYLGEIGVEGGFGCVCDEIDVLEVIRMVISFFF